MIASHGCLIFYQIRLRSFLGIGDNILNIAVQQSAKFIDRVDGYVFAVLDGIVIRLREAHFEQLV